MAESLEEGEKIGDYLHDPTDPTGHRAICTTADEVDAMLEAQAIDPRLPKMIYLRRRGLTLRKIGEICGLSDCMVSKIFEKLAHNLLRDCGLRLKSR